MKQHRIVFIKTPQVTVVGGPIKEIDSLKTTLAPYGFRARHVEPVFDDLGAIASGVVFSAPTIPIVSTLLGVIEPAGKSVAVSSSHHTHNNFFHPCGSLQR